MFSKFKFIAVTLTAISFSSAVSASNSLLPCWSVSNNACTKLVYKFGGWSKHSPASNDKETYNEVHSGQGIEWRFASSSNNRHELSLGYWHMSDSYDMPEDHVGVIYSYKPVTDYWLINMMKLNVSVFAMRRGWRDWDSDTGLTTRHYMKSGLFALPYLTIEPSRYFNVDIMFIPELNNGASSQVLFLRGGLNLDQLPKLFD